MRETSSDDPQLRLVTHLPRALLINSLAKDYYNFPPHYFFTQEGPPCGPSWVFRHFRKGRPECRRDRGPESSACSEGRPISGIPIFTMRECFGSICRPSGGHDPAGKGRFFRSLFLFPKRFGFKKAPSVKSGGRLRHVKSSFHTRLFKSSLEASSLPAPMTVQRAGSSTVMTGIFRTLLMILPRPATALAPPHR